MSIENTYIGSQCLEIVPTLAYLGFRCVVQARCECGTNAWRGPSATYLPPGFLLCCRTYMGYPHNYGRPSGYRLYHLIFSGVPKRDHNSEQPINP